MDRNGRNPNDGARAAVQLIASDPGLRAHAKRTCSVSQRFRPTRRLVSTRVMPHGDATVPIPCPLVGGRLTSDQRRHRAPMERRGPGCPKVSLTRQSLSILELER